MTEFGQVSSDIRFSGDVGHFLDVFGRLIAGSLEFHYSRILWLLYADCV